MKKLELYGLQVCLPSSPADPRHIPGNTSTAVPAWPTLDRKLTGHVHHAAVAHSQHLVGLAEQAAGADAVGVVPGELLLAGGAAVPPGLRQVGQLNTGVG